MKEPLIVIKKLSAKYENKQVLKDINLNVYNNDFLGIIGPNGGGKTTLAKLIAGVEMPTSGKIFLDGENITDLDITDRAKKGIAYAFQQPVRFKGLTVGDLLEIAAGGKMSHSELCNLLGKNKCKNCCGNKHRNCDPQKLSDKRPDR